MHLPVEDIMPSDEPIVDYEADLIVDCSSALVSEVHKLADDSYGGENVSLEQVSSWIEKNPKVLAALVSRVHGPVGYFDVLPLKKVALQAFVTGSTTEAALWGIDLMDAKSAKRSGSIYLAGIAVKNPASHVGRRYASMLVWGLLHYLSTFYPESSGRRLIALGATAEGERLLKRFHPQVIALGTKRRDGHDLYEIQLTTPLVNSVLHGMPDWSPLCRLSWAADNA
jgi:hypothetical protein